MIPGMGIALVGLDGSGKSTQHELLMKHLEERGETVVASREPGSPLLPYNVRDLLISTTRKIAPKARELLFQADRAEHAVIAKEHLSRGSWFITDRCYLDGLAYGLSCGNKIEDLKHLVDFSGGRDWIDGVIFVDTSAKTSFARIKARGGVIGHEEAKGEEFLDSVRKNFISLIEGKSLLIRHKFHTVNGELLADEIASDIRKVVDTWQIEHLKTNIGTLLGRPIDVAKAKDNFYYPEYINYNLRHMLDSLKGRTELEVLKKMAAILEAQKGNYANHIDTDAKDTKSTADNQQANGEKA